MGACPRYLKTSSHGSREKDSNKPISSTVTVAVAVGVFRGAAAAQRGVVSLSIYVQHNPAGVKAEGAGLCFATCRRACLVPEVELLGLLCLWRFSAAWLALPSR